MKEVFNSYMNSKLKLERWQKIGVFFLIVVLSGLCGYIYEFIFYYFNGGMKEFYLQGANFLPWINIYAIGGCMIIILTSKVKKNPLLVFIISTISTGLLEYFSGWAIYKFNNGARYWNYNTEILNFGNIDGFVCLRSVLCFGLSSLLLMYFIFPFCIYLSKKMKKKTFLILSITLFSLVIFDELYNLIIARIFNLTRAPQFYRSIGLKYVKK